MSDAPAEDLAEVHRLALKRVREIVMDVAERLHAQSLEPDADLGEVATKIARVARAVRQTIALEARLADDTRRRAEAEERADADEDKAWPVGWLENPPWPIQMRIDLARGLRKTAERKLEGLSLIRRAIAKAPAYEQEQLEERLYDSEVPSDYVRFARSDISVAEAITMICRSIGFDPDWATFSELDWRLATKETRAELTGAPPPPPPADAPFVPDPPSQANGHDPPHRSTGPPSTWLGSG